MRFTGQRAVRVLLRTGHIAAMAWLLGAAIYGESLEGGLIATLLSGGLLVGSAIVRHGTDWFRYLGSWVVLAKLGVLVAALQTPQHTGPLLAALVLGSLISHAPGRIRQHALWGEHGSCASEDCKTGGQGDSAG